MARLKYAKVQQQFDHNSALGNLAVLINVDTGASQNVVGNAGGVCYGLTCSWMNELKQDKHYLPDSRLTLPGASRQQAMMSAFSSSGISNDLVLAGIGTSHPERALSISNPNQIESDLDTIAQATRANFIVIWHDTHLNNQTAAHVIGAKLNQSRFNGWLNNSYPCSFFDANIGGGMYLGHNDLAAEIKEVLSSYGATWAKAFPIACSTMN